MMNFNSIHIMKYEQPTTFSIFLSLKNLEIKCIEGKKKYFMKLNHLSQTLY